VPFCSRAAFGTTAAAHVLEVQPASDGGKKRTQCAVQVLGITNYSHWPEAHAVRACALHDPLLQRKLTRAAERRLRGFLHVGLMERLDDSIASLSVRDTVQGYLIRVGTQMKGSQMDGSSYVCAYHQSSAGVDCRLR
jgi:hypothetical protein